MQDKRKEEWNQTKRIQQREASKGAKCYPYRRAASEIVQHAATSSKSVQELRGSRTLPRAVNRTATK